MVDWFEPYVLLDSELQAITSEKMQGKKFVDKLIKVKTIDNKVQIIFFMLRCRDVKKRILKKDYFTIITDYRQI